MRTLDPGACAPGFTPSTLPPLPAGADWYTSNAYEQRTEEASLAAFDAWLRYTLLAAALDGIPGLTLAVELLNGWGARDTQWDRRKVIALRRDLLATPGVPAWLPEALTGWLLRENAYPREQHSGKRLEKAAKNRAALAELEAMVPRTPRPLRRVFVDHRDYGRIPVEVVKASARKCTLRTVTAGEGWALAETIDLSRTRDVDAYKAGPWSYRED